MIYSYFETYDKKTEMTPLKLTIENQTIINNFLWEDHNTKNNIT
jgi:hypothetical protein